MGPEDVENFGKADNFAEVELFVISGQHRLKALKLLERQGKLGKITCI